MISYPVNLTIKNKKCVVIGAGDVAARKIKGLLQCEADVHVISPDITDMLQILVEQKKIVYHKRAYRYGDLEGAFLVFAATNHRSIQEAVTKEADQRGIPVNIADAPSSCSFQVPAKIRRGDLLLTISTGGESPALASFLRKNLEKAFGWEYTQLVCLLGRIRDEFIRKNEPKENYLVVVEELMQTDIIEMIRYQEIEKVYHRLSSLVPESIDLENIMMICMKY